MLLKHLSNIPSPSRKPGMVWKHAASTENICNSPSSKWSYYGLLNLRLHLFWNMPHTHRMCFKVCSYPDSHRFIYSLRPHPCICIYIYMCVRIFIFICIYTPYLWWLWCLLIQCIMHTLEPAKLFFSTPRTLFCLGRLGVLRNFPRECGFSASLLGLPWWCDMM